MTTIRFHRHHGDNIILYDNNMVAFRKSSFAHAVTFSEKPLLPGELFLLEIEDIENGWSGHMKLGLTQHDPQSQFPLPPYALPDLESRGHTWISAIQKSERDGAGNSLPRSKPAVSVLGNGEQICTSRGVISRNILLPMHRPNIQGNEKEFSMYESSDEQLHDFRANILPTDVGSRIGVMYIVHGDSAEMHFIFNGEDQGVIARDIPFNRGPLYAVVDVYGTTKQVRIVQLYGEGSLQSACRAAILQHFSSAVIYSLPLPRKLKDYVLYRCL